MTLQRSSVKKVLADEKVNLLIADITLPGSEGEKLMHALGSRSIPFLAVFPPGQRFVNPLCLRDIYSSEDVISAVESAKKGVTE
jgi:thiol:disulfide interchange protein DsbD